MSCNFLRSTIVFFDDDLPGDGTKSRFGRKEKKLFSIKNSLAIWITLALGPGVYILTKNGLRKRSESEIFCRVKMRSESEANALWFSAKRSEANSLRFRNFRNKAKKSEIFKIFFLIDFFLKYYRLIFVNTSY